MARKVTTDERNLSRRGAPGSTKELVEREASTTGMVDSNPDGKWFRGRILSRLIGVLMKLGIRIVDIHEVVENDVVELWGLRPGKIDFVVLDILEIKGPTTIVWVQDCTDKDFVVVGVVNKDRKSVVWANWQTHLVITLSDKVRLAVFS